MAQALKLSAGGANLILGAGFSGRSVPTPGSSASATINIEARSNLEVAPEALIFSISLSDFDTAGPGAGEIYDPRLHDIYYFWDFDDAYTFTAPENIPTAHKEANLAYGPKASHTFRSAGTYNVTCLVVEPASGKSATASRSIEVGNADTAFSGTNTIFLSPTSDWTDAPDGARQLPSGDLDAAITSWGQTTTSTRFMLNRGETFTCSGTGQQGNGTDIGTQHIVAGPGAGAKPIVNCTGSLSWNENSISSGGNTKDWVFQNIEFVGSYDSTTNTGTAIDCITTYQTSPNLLLLDGCVIDGFDHAIFGSDDPNNAHRVMIFNDSVVTNFKQWGIKDNDKKATALTGSRIMSQADSLADATTNGGAPYRASGDARLLIIHSCDFLAKQGWSGAGSGYVAYQAPVRANSSGYEGAEFFCNASAMEGGRDSISLGVQGGQSARAMNSVIEKCLITGSFQSPYLIVMSMGGATIRNNIMIVPDTAHPIGGASNFVSTLDESGDATNAASPIRFYNNSLINLQDDRAAMSELSNSYFSDTTNVNNLIYQPNATSGATTADGPLTTTELWSPRLGDYEDDGVGGFGTAGGPIADTGNPAGTISLYRIGTGSGAYQDATTGLVAYDDFFGDVRGANPSRGALEPV